MRKIVFSLTTGMVAVCALAMLTAVNADNTKRSMQDFKPLELEMTDDESEPPLLLTEETSGQNDQTAPAEELDLAQAIDQAIPDTPADVEANVSNILEAPALNPPAANAPAPVPDLAPAAPTIPAAPVEPADAPVKITAEPKAPQLPPAQQTPGQQSIIKDTALPPAVSFDPTVEMSTPYNQPLPQSLPGNTMVARGPAPIVAGGGCPNCPQGGFGYGYAGTPRPVYYGVQRNGLPAYPRAGNCCGCGGRGCPGCCGFGHRYPMDYPYYTLRGPRDFTDPNPRPIGP